MMAPRVKWYDLTRWALIPSGVLLATVANPFRLVAQKVSGRLLP